MVSNERVPPKLRRIDDGKSPESKEVRIANPTVTVTIQGAIVRAPGLSGTRAPL